MFDSIVVDKIKYVRFRFQFEMYLQVQRLLVKIYASVIIVTHVIL
jgi:hypothetical protein